jgi:hypothetical protein
LIRREMGNGKSASGTDGEIVNGNVNSGITNAPLV